MLFRTPRGTKDVLPQETRIWQAVERNARDVFSLFAFEEIRTPIFEDAKLFSRSLGDSTDIVQKQMFAIKKDTDAFVLRPEATASIVRSYVENALYNATCVSKFYYIGPMFRAERPQKGRLRQFHHLGCEAIGSHDPFLDAEIIFLASRILHHLGIADFEIALNTLGCSHDKKRFALNLREKLLPHKKEFCQECEERFTKNVLRLLDCKNPRCRENIVSLGLGSAHLCDDCRRHFADLETALGIFGVSYKTNPFLVRGLDYYTRTVFEITHPSLGAQDALGAGGRYDHLVEELGGPSRGAVGFALGFERLLLALGEKAPAASAGSSLHCFLIALGDAAKKKCLELVRALTAASVSCDFDYLDGSLKAKLRRADRQSPKFCVIVGDNELNKNSAILKDMRSGTQEEVPFAQLAEKIKGSR